MAAETEPLPFACPFYKFNPAVCDECKKFQFFRISDIKQHLIRCHSLPSRTSTAACHISRFNEQSQILHLQDENSQSVVAPEKLSPEEVEKLKGIKFPRGYDTVRQWFAIWNQLFDGHAEPQSPYIQPNGIKEVISLISPTLEKHLHASLVLSQQYDQVPNHSLPASSAKTIMDNIYHDFCSKLPISRLKPLINGPDLSTTGHGPFDGDSSVSQQHSQLENIPHDLTTTSGPLFGVGGFKTSELIHSICPNFGQSSDMMNSDAETRPSFLVDDCLSLHMQGQLGSEVDISGLEDIEICNWVLEVNQ